ncbi:MAG: TlyA family RNA methyltransferase [Bifidobacteriaceae bacterium]|jgi:23S rRNA (cytidine1920-2'-O)/16S rRNA (cytidine1409-2'-O)-methyltransferase|nr:TlyA family RNA methyltransferase [Bifidobacteriaceae bacterium]MCI1915010.1 TlyA family RNA methyltransferase [Bifidobacteriaceae bacterium]
MVLVHRGLAETRTKAQRLIESGAVSVDGHVETKHSRKVRPDSSVEVIAQGHQYVSRGVYKLLGALEAFGPLGLPSPMDRDCLDIGASTGGFTQVLLEHGARRVIALDVGHGQLVDEIRADERVLEMSGTNIRDVEPEDLAYRPTYVVSDVSFISLTYVIPVIAKIAAPRAEIVLLVKPQFEVGKGNLGKDGIVTDTRLREESLETVKNCATEQGLSVVAQTVSPIEGTHGNVEYLLWLRQAS